MSKAFDQLGAYPSWVRSGIEDFVGKIEGSASDKATIVYRWLQDNPLGSVSEVPPPAAAEQLATELANNARGGGPALSSRAQPGQLGLGEDAFGVGAQPHLPTGEDGTFHPEMLLKDYVPKSTLEAQEIARWRRQLAESRARDEAGGGMPLTDLQQPSLLGEPTQIPMRAPGDGPFDPAMLLKDYVPKSQVEAERIARWRQQIEDSRTRDAAGGGLPLKGLDQSQLEGFIPEALDMPKRIPQVLHDMIEGANQRVTERTGPIDVDKLAQQAGTTADRIRKVWKPDDPVNQDTLRAVSRAIDDSASTLSDLQKTLAKNPEDKDAVVAVVKQLTRHQALQEVLEGRPPSAAEQVKRLDPNSMAAHAESVQALEDMAKRFKLKDGEEMAKHLASVDMSDPSVVNNLAQTARSFTFGDRAAALWYFAMLSSPLTHIKNTIGNMAVEGLRPFESAGSAAVDPLARKLLGDTGPRQRYIQEVPKEVEGAVRSLSDAVPQAWSALKEGWVPERTGDISQFTREPFRGTPLEIPIAAPGRALTAEDTIFRTMNEGASKFGLAEREARKLGLKGEELKDMTARLVQQPTKDMLQQMKDEGAYRVFQQKSEFSQWLNMGRNKYPILRYLMPFTTTPVNVTKFVAERSPLGAAKLIGQYATKEGRAALRDAGSGDMSDRMSRAAIGSLAWGWAVKQGLDGNVTGAAPTDEVERDAFYRQGKQPYSFRNPTSGEWTSYQALPFAQLFETAGDVSAAINKGHLDDKNDLLNIGSSAGLAVAHDMVDQQWTQGLADFFDAWGSSKGDPQAAVGRWVARQAGSLVPGAVRDLTRTGDDTIRDPHNPWEAIRANIPGQSQYVAPQLDAMGNVRKRPSSGAEAILNPMPGTAPTTDPVELELKRLQDLNYNVEPGLVGKQARVAGEDVQMSDPQQWRLQQQSGRFAKTLLDGIVGTDEWKTMSDPEKEKYINNAFADARGYVRQGLEPELIQKAYDEFRRKWELRRAAGTTP